MTRVRLALIGFAWLELACGCALESAPQAASPAPAAATESIAPSPSATAAFPPIYVELGMQTMNPTAGPVSGVGNNTALTVGGGWWGPFARLGAEFEAGGASTCAACSPFGSHWSTLAGGLRATSDVFASTHWALSAGVGFEFTAAFGPAADDPTQHLYRPGLHLSVARIWHRYMRVDLRLAAEYWLSDNPGSLALGARLSFMIGRPSGDE